MKRFSMLEAFAFSKDTIIKHPLLVLVPTILFKLVESAFRIYLKTTNPTNIVREFTAFILRIQRSLAFNDGILWSLVILLVIALLAFFYATVSIGLIRIGCHAFDGHDDQIKWSQYQNFDKKVALPFVGFFLFILFFSISWTLLESIKWIKFVYIPYYIVALMFLFTFYVLVEKKGTFLDALRTSYRLTNGIKGSLIAFFLLYVLIAFVISLPFLIFAYFLGQSSYYLMYLFQPIMQIFLSLATIYIYKDISYQDSHPNEPKEPKEPIDETIQSGDGTRIPIETLLNQQKGLKEQGLTKGVIE